VATEWELKLNIPNDQTAERLMADPEVYALGDGGPVTAEMRARYYDTADSRLEARRWTLRLRQETADGVTRSVAALKIPHETAGDGIYLRDEYEAEAALVEDALPGLEAMGAPPELRELLAGNPLQENCRIEFTRVTFPLAWDDGTRAELTVDRGVIRAGIKSQPILEAELELLFGLPEPLIRLAARLGRDYGLTPGLLSKYARALRMLRSR